jgi:hypothetical protein
VGSHGLRYRTKALLLGIIGAYATFAPSPASAIPAWTRRYGIDCTSCHTGGGWKLTRMGQDFLRRGHSFKDDKPEGSISDYTSFAYKFRLNGGDKKLETFEQHAFAIYTAGPLGKGFSYFTELYLHENSGKNTGTSDFGDFGRSKLAESFLQYNYGKDDSYLSVRGGQLLPSVLHLHNIGARTSQGRPNLWSKSTINPGNTYQVFSRQYGIDAAYRYKGGQAALGFTNGTGTAFNVVDNNQSKDVYASLDYFVGEGGSNVGVLYYKGKHPISDSTGKLIYTDSYDRWVAVGDYSRDHLNLKAAYLRGKDEIDAAGNTAKGSGYYAEAFVWPVERAGVFGRYERWDPNSSNSGDHSDGFTGGVTWRMFDFGRLVADVSKYGKKGQKEFAYTIEYNFMW